MDKVFLSQTTHNSEVQLQEMANDPQIQNELRMIASEFAVTEGDGLDIPLFYSP